MKKKMKKKESKKKQMRQKDKKKKGPTDGELRERHERKKEYDNNRIKR